MFLVSTYMGIVFVALEGKFSLKMLGYYVLYPFIISLGFLLWFRGILTEIKGMGTYITY